MSKKVFEILKNKVAKGDVGVEIEVEGKRLKAVDTAVWRSENDGSLRGRYPETCCEYIFQQPIPVGAVKTAVEGLLQELEGAEFNFSYRTSVHVHVNVQQLTMKQLLSMMYTYYLLEEPLMNFCGRTRKGNNFCLRLADAEGVLDFVTPLFEMGERGFQFIQQDQARYAAMNIESLKKYGSLEFRGMEGNIDPERISKWATTLVKIRDYAMKMADPKAVYEHINRVGGKEFMLNVIGEGFNYARAERDINTSFSISIDLPFSYKEPVDVKEIDENNIKVGDVLNYDQAVRFVNKNKKENQVKFDGRNSYIVIKVQAKIPKVDFIQDLFNQEIVRGR